MTEPAPDSDPQLNVDQSLVEGELEVEAFRVDDLPGGLRAAVEGILMIVDEPVPELRVAAAVQRPQGEVHEVLVRLRAEYAADQRGFELREVAGGWRIYSRPAVAPVVQAFVRDGSTARLSKPALETLAVIAYRQPVSRARIAAVRGVAVDGVVRTLLSRALIEEGGVDAESGAIVYVTTRDFLERMGLASLDELPALAPYLPDVDVLDELAEVTR